MPINNFSAIVKMFSNEQLIMNCLILLMGTITALTQNMGKVDGRELENTPFADANPLHSVGFVKAVIWKQRLQGSANPWAPRRVSKRTMKSNQSQFVGEWE